MSDKRSSLKERLRNQYQLIVRNDDTLEEVAQYKLSVQNLYMLLSMFLLIIGLFIVLLIVFTPIKTLIPGYGELNNNSVLIEINTQLNSLDRSLDAQQVYMNSFQKMLTADEKDEEAEDGEQPQNGDSGMLLKDVKLNNASIQKLYLYTPVNGLVSADFNPKKGHLGIDVIAKKDAPVMAVADGRVVVSDWNIETGNTIGIQHANNLLSFYKHNAKLLKQVGSFVSAGEAIAVVGNSGSVTTGPHLHFEMWMNGNVVNPNDFIEFNSL